MLPQLFTTLLLLIAIPHFAVAQQKQTTLSLNIGRSISDWEINNSKTESRISSAEMTLSESINEHFKSTIHFGYLDLNQPSNSAASGLAMTGNTLGLTLGTRLYRSEYLKLELDIGYRYSRVEGSDEQRRVTMDWQTLHSTLRSTITFNKIALSAGIRQRRLDGDEKESGEVSRTIKLRQEQGYSAGLIYWVEPTGFVGIQLQWGDQAVTRLLFARQFY